MAPPVAAAVPLLRRPSSARGVTTLRAVVTMAPVVRWINENTGEVKERAFSGGPRSCRICGLLIESEWESDSLELALALVADLQTAIDMARMRNQSVNVQIRLMP